MAHSYKDGDSGVPQKTKPQKPPLGPRLKVVVSKSVGNDRESLVVMGDDMELLLGKLNPGAGEELE